MPRKTCFERAFCKANVFLLFILGSYNIGLINDALFGEACSIKWAGVFGTVTLLLVAGVDVIIYEFIVMALHHSFHVFSTTVAYLEGISVEDF